MGRAGGDNARSDRVTPARLQNPAKPRRYGRSPAALGMRRKVAMQTVVIVVHLMIVAVLIATVLLQKSEGGGLGMGGGAGFMSSRGTANLLTRTTAILAVGFFVDQPVSVLARQLQPPVGLDPGCPRHAVAAGRRGNPGRAADQRRSPRFAEEVGSAARRAGADGSGSAAVAIKRGGHAGSHLASCMRNTHQSSENTANFKSPTGPQNVRRGARIVLANRASGLKG